MHPIEMVDLKRQHDKLQPELTNKILQVIDSSRYVGGEEVLAFQNELAESLNVKHVIPCANGTDALQLALMALDLKAGDEVITSNFTYVATAEVIALLKLTPVLVDVDPQSFNIDVDKIKEAITPKTKAIIPVHLFGQSCDMEPIMALAKKHNIAVVEDTAQAIYADYTFSTGEVKKAGTIGDIGTTSFFPSKNLGCLGDGGAIFTNADELAKKLRMIANHGQSKLYYHDKVGVNSRLDAIQAAVLRLKLPHLNAYCQARYQAAQYYKELLKEVEEIVVPFEVANSTHVYHQFVMQVTNGKRDELIAYLKENKIPCNIYYPVPLNQQKAYQQEGNYPITEKLCRSVFAIPMHTELDKDQQEYIINQIKNFFKK